MRRPSQVPASRAWLRLPVRTARLRLTLLYAALFLATGAGLLVLIYLGVNHSSSGSSSTTNRSIDGSDFGSSGSAHQSAPTAATQDHQAGSGPSSDLHHLLIWSVIALVIMTILSIPLGYYIAGRVLKPLRTITNTARTISARNLQERLALNGPEDEFKKLGDTLDDLLARLQTAFEARQQFVANASHELRTPLTVERTLLQVALADPDPTIDSLLTTCQKALVANEQQRHLIEGLLTLASSQGGLDHQEPADLAQLAEQALLTPREERDQLDLAITTTLKPAPTTGDPRLIERLIANLIDNAIHHNTAHGHVEITTGTRNQHAFLTVANSGPVIRTEDVQRLFQPFQRLNGIRTQRNNGYGLGLSIVQAIATAHHAELRADAQPEGGLTIEVSFQRSDEPRGDAPAGEPHVQREHDPRIDHDATLTGQATRAAAEAPR
jgi:signal transduction histidine kinase